MGPPPLRTRLQEVWYFFRYLKPLKWLVLLTILCGFLVNVARTPIMMVPIVLTKAMEPSPPPGLEPPASTEIESSPPAQSNLSERFFGILIGEVNDKSDVFRWLRIVGFSIAVMTALTILRGYLGIKVSESLLRSIRGDVYDRLDQLSMLSVFERGAGPFVQRLTRDVYTIQGLFSGTFIQIIDETSRGLVCAVLCFLIDWKLTAILIVIFLFVWPIVKWVNNQVEHNAKVMLGLSENVISNMVESIGGFRDILAAGKFDYFARRFQSLLDETKRMGIRTGMWGQFSGLFPSTLMSFLILAAYWVFTDRMRSPGDIGIMITYMMYLQQVLPVFGILGGAATEVAMAAPSAHEVRILLEPGPMAPPVPTGSRTVTKPIESIRFENVSLSLGGPPIVENLNFEIPGGKMTAIIGQSGAGKTTIFNLLLRLIPPTHGGIFINNVPLQDIDDAHLRRILGIIPQNPFIFDQTIRDNLLMAEVHDGSGEALNRTVRMAQLEEIERKRAHEGGLDAPAGYMGTRLSGGERQRIALGRLVLQDPDIIICDEYTANIDVKTAQLIQKTMREDFGDRTRVVITHELYTIKGADHIIVLGHGRVADEGVHEDLLKRPGLYRDLWEVQRLEESS